MWEQKTVTWLYIFSIYILWFYSQHYAPFITHAKNFWKIALYALRESMSNDILVSFKSFGEHSLQFLLMTGGGDGWHILCNCDQVHPVCDSL